MQYNKSNLALRVLMFIFLSFWIGTTANATSTVGGTASDVIGNSLCTLVIRLTGTTAKAIGVLALILVSFGVMTAKVNTWTAMSTIIGIFVLFGTPNLVLYISGADTTGCV